MADNPYVNKVDYDGTTLIDLTADTVTSSSLISGVTAHDRSGAPISGSFDPSRYVEKAGDTMTGDLEMHNDSDIHLENGEITFQNEELDSTLLQPSETAYGDQIALKDANGNRIGYLIASVDANDTHGIILSATREDLNTPVYHGVGLYVDSSGNQSVYINEPASWRNALGLGNTSGALPIANGGTGNTGSVSTTTFSDIISSTPSQTTGVSASYASWGKVAQIEVTVKRTNITANTDLLICTIANGKRPKIDTPAILRYNGEIANDAIVTIKASNSAGQIRFTTKQTITSTTELTISATYILA